MAKTSPRMPGLAAALLLGIAPGCGMVPNSRMADCRTRVEGLQAETSRLRDEAVALRSRSRELNQRAVEDARRMRDLETDNERLASRVGRLEEERAEIAKAYDRIKDQLRIAADTPPAPR